MVDDGMDQRTHETSSSASTKKTRKRFFSDGLTTPIISILLLAAGAFGQYRFNLIERFVLRNQTVSPTQLQSSNVLQNTQVPADKASEVNFGTFWEVWKILEDEYIDPSKLVPQTMVEGAISGMTSSLGDPYTRYLPPKSFERSAEDLAGAFYGVGIELGYRDEILSVVSPLADSPAEKAGVQAGDLILRVRDDAKNIDEDSSRWSLNEAVDAIRGEKGTEVNLTLYRDGDNEPFEVAITRGEIVVESAKLEFVEKDGKQVAHIKLSKFGERTLSEWNNIVSEILKQRPNLSGIVLDMRNNPGGLFDGAIEIASDFIPSGVIVSQQGVTNKQDFNSVGTGRLTNIPLVVLVNKGSASASEIVAGALRDRIDAVLVGQQTFGKGTVQDRRDVSGGGGVHITIARWLLPAGSWIHEEGISVDVEVQDDFETPEDEQLQTAIDQL